MLIVMLSLTLLFVSTTSRHIERPRRQNMKEPLRIEEVGRRELQGYERQEKRSEDLNDEEVPMIEEVERREPRGYARQEKRYYGGYRFIG